MPKTKKKHKKMYKNNKEKLRQWIPFKRRRRRRQPYLLL